MKRFAEMYRRLDETNRTNEKVGALEAYFREAPPEDAAWALSFLTGRRVKRGVTHTQMRTWAAEFSGLPQWLVDESYSSVGDLSETLALLLPDGGENPDIPLHVLVEQRLLPLPKLDEAGRRAILFQTWRELDSWQRFCFHKLISGEFRAGVSKILVTRAIAAVAGVEPAVMAHRLTGSWQPTAEDFRNLLSGEHPGDAAKPYPFALAHTVEDAVAWPDLQAALGDVHDWQAEWKWDGIRAQLIRRSGQAIVWSRGEELIGHSFPEIRAAAMALPDGCVLDGEILAWSGAGPLTFNALQQRLHRKNVEPTLFEPEVPIIFMAYDLLELSGADLRDYPLAGRRTELERLLTEAGDSSTLRLSPALHAESWDDLTAQQRRGRDVGAEGLMLKRKDAPYFVGRKKGLWWKWKVDPFTIDAVLIYAQPGNGERAGILSDYTFGVWDKGQLVPVAKAYSGLTDAELSEVDGWIRRHTLDRHGPVRMVEPTLVFELAFEALRQSDRHRSGIAVRFPRMKRWRQDKKAEEADTLQTVHRLLEEYESEIAGGLRTEMEPPMNTDEHRKGWNHG